MLSPSITCRYGTIKLAQLSYFSHVKVVSLIYYAIFSQKNANAAPVFFSINSHVISFYSVFTFKCGTPRGGNN